MNLLKKISENSKKKFKEIKKKININKDYTFDFTIVNKYLYKDLNELGLWSQDIVNKIILASGSIQSIDGIPENINTFVAWMLENPSKILSYTHVDYETGEIKTFKTYDQFYGEHHEEDKSKTKLVVNARNSKKELRVSFR
jgi:DNA-binding ferritin-like protein (Dps family)